ncbi:hypothetical protein G4G28_20550 [Massilia sp. Dwa41.01b]|nr:hypothetical protein G4G28_20550 [Massilia sp. Dwa41.01b]
MRRNNAELEHEAATRPSVPPTLGRRQRAFLHEGTPMTALIRVDAQPGRERPLVIAWLAALVALSWACPVFRRCTSRPSSRWRCRRRKAAHPHPTARLRWCWCWPCGGPCCRP